MIARPFLKILGGKTRLIPDLMKFVPERFGIYHEPFVGGGALYWHLANEGRLQTAWLADADSRLARTWRVVRSYPHTLIRKLRAMPNDKAFFQETRNNPPDAGSSSDVAAWRIYLAKTAFNGIYRLNRSGGFNVPFGGYKKPNIADAPLIMACAKMLRETSTTIRTADFKVSINRAQKKDLVYADCPYIPLSSTSNFVGYTSGGFNDADQVRLRDTLLRAKQRGAYIIASNSDTPRAWELYGKYFSIVRILARRNVGADASKRGSVSELIIT